MKEAFKKNFFFFAVALTSIGYIFSMRLAVWSIIVLLAAAILNFDKWRYNKYYTGMLLFFAVLVLGGLYSSNTERYYEIIQRFLSFLLLPIIFMTSTPLQKKQQISIIRFFIYATAAFHLTIFLYAVYRQLEITIKRNASIDWYLFYRFDYVSLFHQHPTYVAMFSTIAIAFLLFNDKYLNFSSIKSYGLLGLVTFSMLLNGSRQGYALLFLTYFIYLIYKLRQSQHKIKILTIFITGLIGIVILSMQIPIIKERIYLTFGKKQYYKFYYKKTYDNKKNPEKEGRLLVWKDALEVIKQSPILGKGTGSDNDALHNQYLINKHQYLIKKQYNAHNSYIQWLLSGGILLLSAYLLLLGNILIYAIKHRDVISFILFMTLFSISFTETLYRVQGIIFIAFFYSFLLSLQTQKLQKNR